MCRNPLNTVNTSGTKSKVISTNSITLSYVCGVSEKPLIKDLTPTTSLSTTGNIWLTPKTHHQGKKCWLTNKYSAWAVMIFFIGETATPFEETPELFRPHIGCQLLHNPWWHNQEYSQGGHHQFLKILVNLSIVNCLTCNGIAQCWCLVHYPN